MTDKAKLQDFLRRLAEALGWYEDVNLRNDSYQTGEDLEPQHIFWLLTPDGQAYLIERAREKGWKSRAVTNHSDGDSYIEFAKIPSVPKDGGPRAMAKGEPSATAIAVGKMFSVRWEGGE